MNKISRMYYGFTVIEWAKGGIFIVLGLLFAAAMILIRVYA